MNDLLKSLTDSLVAGSSDRCRLDAYYAGTNALTYLSPEAREALNNRLSRVSANVPRLLVDSLAERLRVTGFDGADAWSYWLGADLDQTSDTVHREAMILGSSYVMVWGTQATAESAHHVTVQTDPATGTVTAALKRWSTDTATFCNVFTAAGVTMYRADTKDATATALKVVKEIPNPFGVVPVVPFVNTGRIGAHGVSEMEQVIPLADANTKLLTDLLTASEYQARPRRFASGIELVEQPVLDPATGQPTGEMEAVNPFPESDKMMLSEAPDAKFGQLAGSDLAGYESAVGVIMRQISAVSGLPEHMLGIGGDNPTSADAIRASEAAITAKAEAKQRSFGRSWEQVGRLLVAAGDSTPIAAVDDLRVRWADPSTRSIAQEADAVVKLFSAGLLPADAALRRLGYSEDDVAKIRTARRTEQLDRVGTNLAALLP